MSVERRVERLERLEPPADGGRIVLVETGGDLAPEEEAARLAAARREAGPRGLVIEAVAPRREGQR